MVGLNLFMQLLNVTKRNADDADTTDEQVVHDWIQE